MKGLLYRLRRFLVGLIARPNLTGLENLPDDSKQVVYILHHRALTDLIVLDIACENNDTVSPLESLSVGDIDEKHRFFPLLRSAAGRMTMQTHSGRLTRLLQGNQTAWEHIVLVPVSVFWGRALPGETNLFKTLTSEHWAVTGRIKRLLNLFINRKNIMVHLGLPVALDEVAQGVEPSIAYRRTARLLRVRLRQQKETTLGPDFSHRRTLLNQIVQSRNVKENIEALIAEGMKPKRANKLALKYARTIASDMSHPTIRVLARCLRWFWTKIYDGIDLQGLDNLQELSTTHTMVYVPSHRSHLDYLLLSYLLYSKGFMIPHTAAGDNLNIPILGGILRRAGAFFMRRSFRDDNLYASVFDEYLYHVYRRGHCVEFFPEGSRTRTGRLLPAKLGLLKMSVQHQRRGLPKPLAFVPVYIGYEKLVEASSYLSELRGGNKKKESLLDLARNLKLIRQNFGRVAVNIGHPIKLDEWLQQRSNLDDESDLLSDLGRDILSGINEHAYLNAINLTALVTLATPKLTIIEQHLHNQIELYQSLTTSLHKNNSIRVSTLSASEVVKHTQHLGLITREEESFGTVLTHDPFSAVLMTWYRNNVVHTLALPSLIACLLVGRRRSLSIERLEEMVKIVYPHLAEELSCANLSVAFDRCVEVMVSRGLIVKKDALLSPPAPGHPAQLQLTLLANLVTQNLERMFIVIHQLAQGPIDREELRTNSQLIAKKMSRIYGINAPEFSDQRLFDHFIERLIRTKTIERTAENKLVHSDIVAQILRASEYVIDPHIRFGVLSEVRQQLGQT